MDSNSFNKLPIQEKLEAILNEGSRLFNRTFLHYTIQLYSINDFYAEVWYLPFSNKVDKIETLSAEDVIRLYPHNTDISNLLS